MKILHVNASDVQGGAARASYRLHQGLLAEGVDSYMLVQTKISDDYTVIGPKTKIQKALSKLRPILDNIPASRYKHKSKRLFSSSWVPFSNIVDTINKLNPDLVHLHWITGGMMRIEDLLEINSPIVWSMHDNWGFTGGCHIMWECKKYEQNCGACPQLASVKNNDLSRKIFNRKQKTFPKLSKLYVIGLSNWLTECAKKSTLFKDFEVVCLPNPINTDTFAPFDKLQARQLFNLPVGKKLIGFGAMNATNDVNKGFIKLSQTLEILESENYELVVFGASKPKSAQGFKQKAYYVGPLNDDVSLRILYNAMDVMVVPSLQEAFGQTASESMACGTPVVCFATTGLLDIVDHQINGYLANPFVVEDLANGIEWVLEKANYRLLSQNSRDKVLKMFNNKVVVPQYISLYKRLIYN